MPARAGSKPGEPSADLFGAALAERLAKRGPLAARLRPTTLDAVVGQDHLLGPGRPLRRLIEADRLSSVILWGPPGTGKTTLASLIATATAKRFVPLSAVSAGVKDVRETVDSARRLLAESDRGTILFLDEIHRFNRSQQDALLPSVEDGTLVLIGATTENPMFEVNGPLLSRSKLFRLHAHTPVSLRTLAERALAHEGGTIESDALDHLIRLADGDARSLLTSLDVALALAGGEPPSTDSGASAALAAPDASDASEASEAKPHVTLGHAEAAVDQRVLSYGDDAHYDVISAFIKSIRGSDADAAIYWLARMLVAGEDARFIARRLVILASEDVGMADPMAIVVANAAAHAVEFVGLPEAQLNLAQATVHLAKAPKSNRAALAIWDAMAKVRERSGGDVPIHLRDAHYRGAARLGHGKGYNYPHDDPLGWVPQQYLPDDLVGTEFYRPSVHGYEKRWVQTVNSPEPVVPTARTVEADTSTESEGDR